MIFKEFSNLKDFMILLYIKWCKAEHSWICKHIMVSFEIHRSAHTLNVMDTQGPLGRGE